MTQERVPFWQDPAIRLAVLTALAPALYRILVGAGVHLPFAQEWFAQMVVDVLSLAGGVIWVARRIKNGNDPANPQPKVVIK